MAAEDSAAPVGNCGVAGTCSPGLKKGSLLRVSTGFSTSYGYRGPSYASEILLHYLLARHMFSRISISSHRRYIIPHWISRVRREVVGRKSIGPTPRKAKFKLERNVQIIMSIIQIWLVQHQHLNCRACRVVPGIRYPGIKTALRQSECATYGIRASLMRCYGEWTIRGK